MAKTPTSKLTQDELNDPDLLFCNADMGDITVGYNAAHYRFLKSVPAAVLYNCLTQKAGYYNTFPEQNPREDGFFYYTAKQFEAQTGFGEYAFARAQDILLQHGIIEKKVAYIVDWHGRTQQRATHFRMLRSLTKVACRGVKKDVLQGSTPPLAENRSENPPSKSKNYDLQRSEPESKPASPSFKNIAPRGGVTLRRNVSYIYETNNKHTSLKSRAISACKGAVAPRDEKETKVINENTKKETKKEKVVEDDSFSLNEDTLASPASTPPSSAAPPSAPVAAPPFEQDVSGASPADLIERERKAKNAEIASVLKELAQITHYDHPLQNTTLRQAVQRALNTYRGDELVQMAALYMEDNGKYPMEKKRLRHFLNDNVLDALDADLKSVTLTPKFDESLPDVAVRINIWKTAEQRGFDEILRLSPNAPDFIPRALKIMEGDDGSI